MILNISGAKDETEHAIAFLSTQGFIVWDKQKSNDSLESEIELFIEWFFFIYKNQFIWNIVSTYSPTLTKIHYPYLTKLIDFNMRNITISTKDIYFKEKHYFPEETKYLGKFDIELSSLAELEFTICKFNLIKY